MDTKVLIRLLPRVILGVLVNGIGIAMTVVSGFGLGPWTVFHQGLADQIPVSLGAVILIVGAFLTTLFYPLGEKIGAGTLFIVALLGLSVDASLEVVDGPLPLAWRVGLMICGPVVIAVGTGLYIGAGLGPGPRDGLMTGIAKRGHAIWKARTAIEAVILLLGFVLGGAIGIGTLWFALSIGPLVHFFVTKLTVDPARRWTGIEPA